MPARGLHLPRTFEDLNTRFPTVTKCRRPAVGSQLASLPSSPGECQGLREQLVLSGSTAYPVSGAHHTPGVTL